MVITLTSAGNWSTSRVFANVVNGLADVFASIFWIHVQNIHGHKSHVVNCTIPMTCWDRLAVSVPFDAKIRIVLGLDLTLKSHMLIFFDSCWLYLRYKMWRFLRFVGWWWRSWFWSTFQLLQFLTTHSRWKLRFKVNGLFGWKMAKILSNTLIFSETWIAPIKLFHDQNHKNRKKLLLGLELNIFGKFTCSKVFITVIFYS